MKLKVKLPATKHGYSMAKIAHLDDALSQFFELEASPVEGQSLLQEQKKKKLRAKRKFQKIKA